MTEKSMRIEEALTILATSSVRTADALERLVALGEAQRNDVGAMRQQIEETLVKMARELQAAMPKIEEAAALIEQADEEKSEESEEEEDEEGQQQVPAADEAPAKPEPVEVKQEKKEEPAATTEPEPAKTVEKSSEVPAPVAEQTEPMDLDTFREEFLKLTRKYGGGRVREANDVVVKRFNLVRLSACAPAERAAVIGALKAELGAGA